VAFAHEGSPSTFSDLDALNFVSKPTPLTHHLILFPSFRFCGVLSLAAISISHLHCGVTLRLTEQGAAVNRFPLTARFSFRCGIRFFSPVTELDVRRHMNILFSYPRITAVLITGALLSACTATTTVTISPPGQAPICQSQSGLKAAVLWRTNWRPNQKDIPEREAAASQGIADFFSHTRCFPSTVVTRADSGRVETAVPPGSDLLLLLTVRELGPTVKLLSSAALVEGGRRRNFYSVKVAS